ncbi:MAG: hypothetical protein KKA64_01580 [Nanoarchaeota archaeon]|nr:hypothetical protein [Nanoarchaeota archaeon]
MGKEIVLSNVGFFLGMIGVLIAVIPFFNMNNPQIYNIILPMILGIYYRDNYKANFYTNIRY